MPRLDRNQTRFKALGIELYGPEGWQREFARATGLSHQLVNFIANGDRAVTGAVRTRVILGLHDEVKRLRNRAAAVAAAVRDYQIE
jgi:hypothetical protein